LTIHIHFLDGNQQTNSITLHQYEIISTSSGLLIFA